MFSTPTRVLIFCDGWGGSVGGSTFRFLKRHRLRPHHKNKPLAFDDLLVCCVFTGNSTRRLASRFFSHGINTNTRVLWTKKTTCSGGGGIKKFRRKKITCFSTGDGSGQNRNDLADWIITYSRDQVSKFPSRTCMITAILLQQRWWEKLAPNTLTHGRPPRRSCYRCKRMVAWPAARERSSGGLSGRHFHPFFHLSSIKEQCTNSRKKPVY